MATLTLEDLKKTTTITGVEILDHNEGLQEDMEPTLGMIEVIVEFSLNNKTTSLQYQTQDTRDGDAVNSNLWIYKESDAYETIYELAGGSDKEESEKVRESFCKWIKEKAGVQHLYDSYIEKHYTKNSGYQYFDGNSECNKLGYK